MPKKTHMRLFTSYCYYNIQDIKDARPEKLRKDITELFSEYAAVREHIRPLLLEKRGVRYIHIRTR